MPHADKAPCPVIANKSEIQVIETFHFLPHASIIPCFIPPCMDAQVLWEAGCRERSLLPATPGWVAPHY